MKNLILILSLLLITPVYAQNIGIINPQTNASALTTGTLPAGRMPALTGDVTSSTGSVATTLATGSASNLNSGTLAAARGGAGAVNGVLSGNGSGAVSQGATTGLTDTTTDSPWTPTDASGAALTFTSITARYTKVGKAVTAFFRLTFPSTANASTSSIGGLPVASSANYPATNTAAGSCFISGVTNTVLTVLIQQSATAITLNNNVGVQPLNSTLSTLVLSCFISYIST